MIRDCNWLKKNDGWVAVFLAQPVSCNVPETAIEAGFDPCRIWIWQSIISKQITRQRSQGKAHNAIDYRRLEREGIMRDGFFILPRQEGWEVDVSKVVI